MENPEQKIEDHARLQKPSHSLDVEKVEIDTTPLTVARMAIIVIAIMAAGKIGIGLLIQSVAILSEGLHTLIDLFAAVISYYTIRAASEPADLEHRYGHGKIENAAGIAQAAFIFVPTIVIIYRAVLGIMRLETVLSEGGADLGTGIMFLTILVNIYLAYRLLKVAKEYKSEAVRAAAYHQLNDLWTSIGVMIALALIWWNSDLKILDPLVALAVTAISIWMAWSLFRVSLSNLVDISPGAEIDTAVVKVLKDNEPVVRSYHNLRTRRAGSTIYADLHVEVCGELSFRDAHTLTEKIESELAEKLDGADIIIHADPCIEDCHTCDLEPGKDKSKEKERKR